MTEASAAPHDSLLTEEHPGGVVLLTLNRPARKNALDRKLVVALGDALAHFSSSEATRVIVISGAGDSFCSGADLPTITGATPEEIPGRVEEFHRLITGIVHAKQPVIAAVHGPAVGFGADLALACDLRLFTNEAFIEEGFIKVGLMPDGGGTLWMQRAFGARAFELLALGSRISAEECQQAGIANKLVPSDALVPEALSLAQKLSASAPLALAQIKRSLRARDREELTSALEREKSGQSKLILSRDFEEGVRAFMEKRPAKFQGK